MRGRTIVWLLTSVVVATAAPAEAQVFVTPHVGAHFGGGTIDSRTVSLGGGAGVMVGLVGFEVDYGFAPDFFPPEHPSANLHAVGDLATLMGNVVVGNFGTSIDGGWYVTGGIGAIRILADEPTGRFVTRGTELGYNVGGGVVGFFTDRIGLRGDVRYLHDLRGDDLTATGAGHHADDVRFESFGFMRATVGVLLRF